MKKIKDWSSTNPGIIIIIIKYTYILEWHLSAYGLVSVKRSNDYCSVVTTEPLLLVVVVVVMILSECRS